jgi:hypothetical protein
LSPRAQLPPWIDTTAGRCCTSASSGGPAHVERQQRAVLARAVLEIRLDVEARRRREGADADDLGAGDLARRIRARGVDLAQLRVEAGERDHAEIAAMAASTAATIRLARMPEPPAIRVEVTPGSGFRGGVMLTHDPAMSNGAAGRRFRGLLGAFPSRDPVSLASRFWTPRCARMGL